MNRPADALTVVLRHNGVDVYAPPRCESCGAESSFQAWTHLPTLAAIQADLSSLRVESYCEHCRKPTTHDRQTAYRAREPERLAARLAELKAGAA